MTQPKANPFPGVFILAGVLTVAAGMWWIYRPGIAIVLGLALLGLGFAGRRPGAAE
jgi:hypothetical protein